MYWQSKLNWIVHARAVWLWMSCCISLLNCHMCIFWCDDAGALSLYPFLSFSPFPVFISAVRYLFKSKMENFVTRKCMFWIYLRLRTCLTSNIGWIDTTGVCWEIGNFDESFFAVSMRMKKIDLYCAMDFAMVARLWNSFKEKFLMVTGKDSKGSQFQVGIDMSSCQLALSNGSHVLQQVSYLFLSAHRLIINVTKSWTPVDVPR